MVKRLILYLNLICFAANVVFFAMDPRANWSNGACALANGVVAWSLAR